MSLVSLYIRIMFWAFLLAAKDDKPHSLYKLSKPTDLVNPVTIRAASYCNRSN